MTAALAAPPVDRLAVLAPAFRQIGDAKRIRVAHADGSAAERGFTRAWAALAAGVDAQEVADRECAAALAGSRLGGIDAVILRDCGLAGTEVAGVLGRAAGELDGALHPATRRRLRAALPTLGVHDAPDPPVPAFAAALCRQPRAGATAPGLPRLVVEPPESHADHCWAVAVYGALLADDVGADPADAFLLGLAHHLHNAWLPDAGFAGEQLLGGCLGPLVERLTALALSHLPDGVAARVGSVLPALADAGTAVGQAFHAADVLDRVLQVHHHARAAAFTTDQALVDLALVHDGPVVDYHRAVLRAAGL
ncbi:hypothetical protein ACIA5A_26475 [Micromonospora sp. NPDC051300]|uniref:hypothetical protein n=1 Tax=Micromonospora sp. NPDC051300 TaxID=3364286 RepID=UPI0037AC0C7D